MHNWRNLKLSNCGKFKFPRNVSAACFELFSCLAKPKGCHSKNISCICFVFTISQHIQNQNLKILVSTPHNHQGIMWCRDKNFKVSLLYELRKCEDKNMRESFLL